MTAITACTTVTAGAGSDSSDCFEVKKICCFIHSRKSVQYGQVSVHSVHMKGNSVNHSFYSFSFLWGPLAHLIHLLSCERLPFTLAYLATVVGTLYCALSVGAIQYDLISHSTCCLLSPILSYAAQC